MLLFFLLNLANAIQLSSYHSVYLGRVRCQPCTWKMAIAVTKKLGHKKNIETDACSTKETHTTTMGMKRERPKRAAVEHGGRVKDDR